MADTTPPAQPQDAIALAASPALERRANALLLFMVALLLGAALYLLYARGVFEATQSLTLVAEDSEGVTVGMDLTFSGFPIGRVSRITLGPDGSARIRIEVPRQDARWLRSSSVFTLSRGLVGGTAIRAYTGLLGDPPLPDGAERPVLIGDATAEIPRLVATVKDLMANLTTLTAADGALANTLQQTQVLVTRLNGPGGALGLLTGDPQDAAKVLETIERSNRLLASINTLVGRADGLVARADGVMGRADARLLGPEGLVADSQATVQQLRQLLGEARQTLQGVDKLLGEAQGVAQNARGATTDLDQLRAETEASLRKVQSLVNELNRRWPLARDTELKLP